MADELDRILSIEESALSRNAEIERILECPEGDYFSTMEINPMTCPSEDLISIVRKIYRKKSLLIHPDKSDHARAPEAFDKLKKAEAVLSSSSISSRSDNSTADELFDEKTRLLSIYKAAAQNATRTTSPSDNFNDKVNVQIRNEVKEILEDEKSQLELQKLAKQSEETRKQEYQKQVNKERELKRKADAQWEDQRDSRVKKWRQYSNKVEKKSKAKKKSPKVLV
ncbi:uncharacterized protein LODBEIA_P08940 [Lodderomyces beijingensis]|uniref:J domain-containing protein n=1 Tax=Lodderomyces beijingensis TaxID=1775926 RepID=A0ABP0ZES7_9ASCO